MLFKDCTSKCVAAQNFLYFENQSHMNHRKIKSLNLSNCTNPSTAALCLPKLYQIPETAFSWLYLMGLLNVKQVSQ